VRASAPLSAQADHLVCDVMTCQPAARLGDWGWGATRNSIQADLRRKTGPRELAYYHQRDDEALPHRVHDAERLKFDLRNRRFARKAGVGLLSSRGGD